MQCLQMMPSLHSTRDATAPVLQYNSSAEVEKGEKQQRLAFAVFHSKGKKQQAELVHYCLKPGGWKTAGRACHCCLKIETLFAC
jgi:hypothetical protein